jgi:integrase
MARAKKLHDQGRVRAGCRSHRDWEDRHFSAGPAAAVASRGDHGPHKHVNSFSDRYGKVRHYFRKRGCKDVMLPGQPGSAEFMDAYAAALSNAAPIVIGAKRVAAGTVAATVGLYLSSTAFGNLAEATQRSRSSILERFRADHGDKPVAKIRREHVQAMVDAKAKKPSTAQNFLHALRALVTFAIKSGIRDDDPTLGVTRPKIKTEGYKPWEESDVAVYKARHPSGTLARLALELLLCTGQRRKDIVGMGRQHVRGDTITVRQHKTGTVLAIPINPDLRAELDAMPADRLIFLAANHGGPRKAGSFGTWFRALCNEAGVRKGLSAHGLRKLACIRLAEAGCTAHEIMAISGHKSLKEVERYTKAADQERLARAAVARLATSQGVGA